MTDCCTQLYLREIKNIPDQFKELSGNVSFDITDNVRISLNKEFDKLNKFNQITGEAILPFSLPKTKKNNYILECYGYDILANIDTVVSIPITLLLEGWLSVRQDVLFVRSANAGTPSGFWEVELLSGESFWKVKMQDLNVCEIDFGTYLYNKAVIQGGWTVPAYNTSKNVYLPVIHYGNWLGADTATWFKNVMPEDLRPLFYITAILELGFKHVGWTFKSPILQSDDWRRKICYILEKEITYTGQGEYFKVIATRQIGVDISFNMAVGTRMTATQDSSSSWNMIAGFPGDGWFLSTHYFNQRMKVKLNLNMSSLEGFNLTIKVHIYDRVNAINYHTYIFTIPAVSSFNVITESPCFVPENNAEIIFYFEYVTTPGLFTPFLGSGSITFEMCDKRFYINDNIQLNEIIDCEIKFLDLFKAVLHLIGNGRIVTDYNNKTVYVYHPDDTVLCDGTSPEPYYIDKPTRLDVSCDSLVNNIGELDQSRFIELSFKDVDDYLESLGFSDTNKPYSKTIDLGQLLNNNDTETSENPLFHPTGNIDVTEIESATDEPINVPAMWDNTNDEISYDIKPRILHIVDYVAQVANNPALLRFWSFGDTVIIGLAPVPFATQLTDVLIQPAAIQLPVCENVVYGDVPFDLYSIYWEKEINRFLLLVDTEFLVFISLVKYDYLDGRNIYQIYYEGFNYCFRLRSVTDKQACSKIPTPSSFSKIT